MLFFSCQQKHFCGLTIFCSSVYSFCQFFNFASYFPQSAENFSFRVFFVRFYLRLKFSNLEGISFFYIFSYILCIFSLSSFIYWYSFYHFGIFLTFCVTLCTCRLTHVLLECSCSMALVSTFLCLLLWCFSPSSCRLASTPEIHQWQVMVVEVWR